MAVLVVAAHDSKTVRSQRRQRRRRRAPDGPGRRPCWCAGSNAGEAAKSAAAIAGRRQGAAGRGCGLRQLGRRGRRAAGRQARAELQPHRHGSRSRSARTWRRGSRPCSMSARSPRRSRSCRPTPSCGRSMPATPWRRCRPPTRSRSSPSARPTSRRPPAAARRRSRQIGGDRRRRTFRPMSAPSSPRASGPS